MYFHIINMFIKENKTIIMFLMNSTHVLSHNNNYNNITERKKLYFLLVS